MFAHSPRSFFLFLFAAISIALLAMGASAAGDEPVQWSAEEMIYDRENDIVTARGRVELHYRGNVLYADEIIFDQAADEVVAKGNIRFVDRNNDIVTAESLVLTGDLRDGVVKGVRVFFHEGERLAAQEGVRADGRFNTLNSAVYSPCKVCDDEGKDIEPLWQIKAEKVVHDEEKRTLTYKNAYLELFGAPVLYTPWLKHPDATVEKASGLLTPKFDSSTILGFAIEIPYFWNIAANKDLTISPKITTDEGIILNAEYRHRIRQGVFRFSGSATSADERDDNNQKTGRNIFRGHLFGDGRFTFGDDWRWGFDVAVASDDTYLRRYDIARIDSLHNRLFINKSFGRSYFSATGYAFQRLREENVAGQTPIILPFVEYNYVGKPGWLGGRFAGDASLLMLTRTDGHDTGRVSAGANWTLPYTSPFGELYKLTVGFRSDLYYTDGYEIPGTDRITDSEVVGRVIPYAMLEWRLPLVRYKQHSRQVIEPIVTFVASPYGGNPEEIPNEDSLSFDFDITNLFALNRYSGLDRWEGGPRVNYGIKFSHYTNSGVQANLVVGQSYRFREDLNFPIDSGLRDKLSDVVIGASLHVPGWFDYYHRLRLDKDSFKVIRNEGVVVFGPERFRFSIGYTDVNREGFDPTLRDRREIRTAARLQIARYWSVAADFSYDFEPDGGILTTGASVTYEDECFKFRLNVRRDFTEDRDIRPSTSVGFQLIFKVVGG